MSEGSHRSRRILFVIDSMTGGGAERVLSEILNGLDRVQFMPGVCLSLGDRQCYAIPEDVRTQYLLRQPWRFPFVSFVCCLLALMQSLSGKCGGRCFRERYGKAKLYFEAFGIAMLRLHEVVLRDKPDLIVSFLMNSNIIVLLSRIFFRIRVPVCISDHNYLSNELRSMPYSRLYRFVLHCLYPRVDAYIATGHRVAEDVIERFKLPKERVFCIYNGVDIGRVWELSQEPLDPQACAIAGHKSGHRIVTVGRLVEQKGHEHLLRAFRQVREQVDCQLLIVGDGHMKGQLQDLARSLGLDDSVLFLGWQSNPFKYMAGCDAYVMSSLWEGMPLVLIEAMALNLPIVSTDCLSGPREILDNGRYGFLEPVKDEAAMADRIVSLLADATLRESMALKSMQRAAHFTVERMTRQYEQLFTRLTHDSSN